MQPSLEQRHFLDALKIKNVRLYIGSVGFATLAGRALAVVIGFQIYMLTHSTLALGLLGLVEAIPVIALVLFGGYVADHYDRKKILLRTGIVSCLCTLALAFLSWKSHHSASLIGLYAVIFVAGIARGFSDPASTAFETQVVPQHLTVNGGSWISSTWISCSIIGPAAIGFIFSAGGAITSYLVILGCFIVAWFCTRAIDPSPQIIPEQTESVFKSIGTGWKFVFNNQPLLGALTLDLFAVLFGGAMALLPVYANDILHVGVQGLGLLNAAPSLGALLITLLATHRPPIENAGRNLLLTVAGFGASILIFAFSKNFFVSMAALFLSGAFDGISVVIRRSMVRLLSPEHLRGRVAAASWIFICSSNELGAFESGLLASLIGTIPCVAVGGILTFVVVGLTALGMPQLRHLRFDSVTLERKA